MTDSNWRDVVVERSYMLATVEPVKVVTVGDGSEDNPLATIEMHDGTYCCTQKVPMRHFVWSLVEPKPKIGNLYEDCTGRLAWFTTPRYGSHDGAWVWSPRQGREGSQPATYMIPPLTEYAPVARS